MKKLCKEHWIKKNIRELQDCFCQAMYDEYSKFLDKEYEEYLKER